MKKISDDHLLNCSGKIKKKALTLVELLMIIVLLIILALLIIPRFEAIKADAQKKVCLANLRGLISAMTIYETREKNSNIQWSDYSPRDLVDWGYLVEEPYCAYDVEQQHSYILESGARNNDLDRAICPFADKYPEHVWP